VVEGERALRKQNPRRQKGKTTNTRVCASIHKRRVRVCVLTHFYKTQGAQTKTRRARTHRDTRHFSQRKTWRTQSTRQMQRIRPAGWRGKTSHGVGGKRGGGGASWDGGVCVWVAITERRRMAIVPWKTNTAQGRPQRLSCAAPGPPQRCGLGRGTRPGIARGFKVAKKAKRHRSHTFRALHPVLLAAAVTSGGSNAGWNRPNGKRAREPKAAAAA
jgi:hypothetical protein